MLKGIKLHDFRNFNELALEFKPGINLITGANGSGKSSILESIFYMARGRSFRAANTSLAIKDETARFTIIVNLCNNLLLASERLRNGKVTHKINGTECSSLVELSEHLPLLFLDTDSQRWLAAGPKNRRQTIDWGLFYGRNQEFFQVWKNFRRSLLQRNAAIKAKVAFSTWDKSFIEYSNQINAQRSRYVADLQTTFDAVWQQCEVNNQWGQISVNYSKGWQGDLETALKGAAERDIQYGYSNVGPHRSDLLIKIDNKLAHTHLSQGQQKLLTYAITVAQAHLYKQDSGTSCLLLLDDLCAELDLQKRAGIISLLLDGQHQIITTGVVASEISQILPKNHHHIDLEKKYL